MTTRTIARHDLAARLRVVPGSRPRIRDVYAAQSWGWEREQAEVATAENLRRLGELQYKMYADGRYALLVVLQAIDGGGKDSTVRRVFGAFNPQGCTVTSFKPLLRRSSPTTSSGGSIRTSLPVAKWPCSTARTTRTY